MSCFNHSERENHIIYGWYESEPIFMFTITASMNMPKGYSTSNMSVHFMNYHFVWCPKYRRKVIVPDAESGLQDIIRDTAKENN
jgi:hypothetical protein